MTQGSDSLTFSGLVSDKNRVLTGTLFALFLTGFVLTAYLFTEEVPDTTGPNSSAHSGDSPTLWAGASLVSFGDAALASTLVFILWRRRSQTSFARTTSMIDRVMMYTIGTGLLTAAFALAGSAAALIMRHNLVWVTVLEMLPKRKFDSLDWIRGKSLTRFSVPQLHAHSVRILTCS